MSFNNIVHIIAVVVLPLLFAITLHEAAHGWVANKLGDKTALMMGRVTLNPLKHIDPFGTVILPILILILSKFTFAFGWAKPVPVTWQNLRKPRRDMALVAVAGPLSNLFMALLWAAIAKLSVTFGVNAVNPVVKTVTLFFYHAGLFGILINLVLMLLNLIPVPPLDGSRIVSAILPPKAAYAYSKIEPYGIWILLGLLIFGLLGRLLLPMVLYLMNFVRSIFGLPGNFLL
ncbi:site-2 protease family protein [Coxiella burnetii]|uniref:site-2 protease family protein n=1 Tax=Coxiella burnetii TaxID=777 RepID=UPI0000DAEB0D|nr:site-2 protease family protein [Coxiella burnetii]ABX78254.1 peptidase, M50 family protein [Coxiella burnetii RSA 331]ATN82741.1 peptidase M50 [Coxiella burnetii]ATN84644.1 peptidase M50 [Coxiella burnetii]POZ75590.1 site-2 protease family protein [Coxiella burnetii]